MYAADTTPGFEIGTVAIHTCNAGFALVGDMTRTCMDDDQADIFGVWSGSPPTCEGNHFKSCFGLVDYLLFTRMENNFWKQYSDPFIKPRCTCAAKLVGLSVCLL